VHIKTLGSKLLILLNVAKTQLPKEKVKKEDNLFLFGFSEKPKETKVMEEKEIIFGCFPLWVDVFGSWKFCVARTEWRGGEQYFWVLFLLGILVVTGPNWGRWLNNHI
jgi:hypothetical protein